MYFDQIHFFYYSVLFPPNFLNKFNRFHCSIFIYAYEVLQSHPLCCNELFNYLLSSILSSLSSHLFSLGPAQCLVLFSVLSTHCLSSILCPFLCLSYTDLSPKLLAHIYNYLPKNSTLAPHRIFKSNMLARHQ
jgi:hypothetical protein